MQQRASKMGTNYEATCSMMLLKEWVGWLEPAVYTLLLYLPVLHGSWPTQHLLPM